MLPVCLPLMLNPVLVLDLQLLLKLPPALVSPLHRQEAVEGVRLQAEVVLVVAAVVVVLAAAAAAAAVLQ